jgi:BASS family bile acid:Na+ symporter
MDLLQIIVLVCNLSIVATSLGYGLSATSHDILYIFKRQRLLHLSLISMFVVTPTAALAVVFLFDSPLIANVAMVTLALSPVSPALLHRQRKSGGNHSYAISLTIAVILFSIVITPLLVRFLGRLMGRPFDIDFFAVGYVVLILALIPLIVGMMVRFAAPKISEKAGPAILKISNIVLSVAILGVLIVSLPVIWEVTSVWVVIPFLIFNAIALAIGHLMGGPEDENSVVLAFSTASRHPAIALTVATAAFPGQSFTAAIMLCMVANAIVSAIYLRLRRMWISRKTASKSVPSE